MAGDYYILLASIDVILDHCNVGEFKPKSSGKLNYDLLLGPEIRIINMLIEYLESSRNTLKKSIGPESIKPTNVKIMNSNASRSVDLVDKEDFAAYLQKEVISDSNTLVGDDLLEFF
jgi:septum formation inhibitor-activating ATPase MinD